ncbi:hypothetical protein BpHYR1_018427 [Brachionus plicatilis]|uniref:Uncharacterized protein n=1 Tax=Brachionus plicatilis TaxID=10195 RepID=A0A3M7PJ08_BRAPC|nr:hypothetical protein BpHYR1_018427 [Brachionus plicatilis]
MIDLKVLNVKNKAYSIKIISSENVKEFIKNRSFKNLINLKRILKLKIGAKIGNFRSVQITYKKITLVI